MARLAPSTGDLPGWIADYQQANPERLDDAEFAAWLESEYVPIAGGWQY